MPQAVKAAESHAQNSRPIDFTAGRPPEQLDQLVKKPSRSRYVRKLQELVDAIAVGKAEAGMAYPLGHFNDAGTAANTMRSLAKRKDLPLHYAFELVPLPIGEGKSALWASATPIANTEVEVPAPSDDDIRAIEDEVDDENDGITFIVEPTDRVED